MFLLLGLASLGAQGPVRVFAALHGRVAARSWRLRLREGRGSSAVERQLVQRRLAQHGRQCTAAAQLHAASVRDGSLDHAQVSRTILK